VTIRPLQPEDAEAFAALNAANRETLTRYFPFPDEFFTADGQRELIERANAGGVHLHQAHPFAILDGSAIAGAVNIFAIRRGTRQICTISFWVDRERGGRGLATSAVEDSVAYAFGELALRRIFAPTFADNVASQRVLEKASFERVGAAGDSVRINGELRAPVLFQRVAGA